MPRAHDPEKSKYIPGIFDSVQLIFSGTPNLIHIQTAPNIDLSKVHVQALVHNSGANSSTPVTFTVREKRSGKVVGTATIPDVHVPSATDKTVDTEISIPHCHLWSPEDPFLYTVEVTTTADKIVSAFGIREFHFDPVSGHAILNDKPYFMRDSNTTLYRFRRQRKKRPSMECRLDPASAPQLQKFSLEQHRVRWYLAATRWQPTKVSRAFYENILGPSATVERYRETYAHYMAVETEFWRSNRCCAGVMEFTALGYSEPNGTTSDHFLDIKNLIYEPHMAAAFKNAFAPVGVMIDYWESEMIAGSSSSISVVVINDLAPAWNGIVHLVLRRAGKVVFQKDQMVSVESFDTQKVTFNFEVPVASGDYGLQASTLGADGQTVVSDRAFPVITEADQITKWGYPVKAATASSERSQNNFLLAAINAAKDNGVGWSSEFSGPQWIALDVGGAPKIGRVLLNWEAAYATSYRLETSSDGQNWTQVYATDAGKGGIETLTFSPVTARWIRMFGIKRATKFGYFLWGFHVYGF